MSNGTISANKDAIIFSHGKKQVVVVLETKDGPARIYCKKFISDIGEFRDYTMDVYHEMPDRDNPLEDNVLVYTTYHLEGALSWLRWRE